MRNWPNNLPALVNCMLCAFFILSTCMAGPSYATLSLDGFERRLSLSPIWATIMNHACIDGVKLHFTALNRNLTYYIDKNTKYNINENKTI